MRDREAYLAIASCHAEMASVHIGRLIGALEYGKLLTEHQTVEAHKIEETLGKIQWDIAMATRPFGDGNENP